MEPAFNLNFQTDIQDRLPRVRGRYGFQIPLGPLVWFRVGGAAEVVYKPADLEDLRFFLKYRPRDIPLCPIGVGSNILVRDGGIPGVVLRLGQGFSNIFVEGSYVFVGAGVLDRTVSLVCADAGIGGLEFLAGIPGTIGGALRMNAGCYGKEIADVLVFALALDPLGGVHRLTPEKMKMKYRHCGVPKSWIFISACFRGTKSHPTQIHQQIAELLKEREVSQPVTSRTGGSTFANPEGRKAWELIDQAGCRGLQIGGARISDLHCNFMLNTGDATAQDLETLGEEVRHRVLETSGLSLRWEIERLGRPL